MIKKNCLQLYLKHEILKDYYQTLGIERIATQKEIKQAYRKLALKFHPDQNNSDNFFEERFRQIQQAYEILGDQYEKRKYDDEYDRFFSERENYQTHNQQTYQSKYEEPKVDPEVERNQKEQREKFAKEDAEMKRVREIKRKAGLAFEDKAWIAIGSGFTVGILGVVMFFKYLAEGYIKKSKQVCVVAIVGFVILMFLSLLLQIAR